MAIIRRLAGATSTESANGVLVTLRSPTMRLSTIALVLANLVPLLGTLLLGWSVFEIFALYWSESVVIGAYTILRIVTVRPAGQAWPLPAAIGLSAFFCVHYGIFLVVHAVFVVMLVGPDRPSGHDMLPGAARTLFETAVQSGGGLGLLALAASHGVSFVVNFLGGERTTTTPQRLMIAPYPRIVAMHLVLLAGGLVLTTKAGGGGGNAMLALLVVAKTLVDGFAHRAEHRRLRQGGGAFEANGQPRGRPTR